MRLAVDRDRCCGSGMCSLLAASVFDQSADDGRVLLLTPVPPPDQQGAARRAVDTCPVGAIREVVE
ncbi:ferredoxin [Nocardia terpenica]|uniref:Ferredoxin n=1 Tax=Nocardia terpenica TaxID=455432 RepID=A0A164M7Q8_9NOCA|nr:ferredoxin [Nocardia terpenica]KZM73121.1 ferredoxin [Nocardia terpenica]NQE91910.1 ferredoxin [Nocardia terpenica]QIS19762.1 ferredoxin [Nocardia terpenica]